MISKRRIFDIHHLNDMGFSERKIAHQLGISRQTVQKYLTDPNITPQPRLPKSKKLDIHVDQIQGLLSKWPEASAVVIKQRIEEQGYDGGLTILRDYLRTLRSNSLGSEYIRFESPPGYQCQCDWGHFGSLPYGNTSRLLYCMTVIECYSRMLYVEFTHSQRKEAFMRTLLNAFIFFGGTCKELVHDNLKTAVIERVGDIIRFNEDYLHFLRPFHIEPYACHLGQAHEKGKIEKGGIQYVRYNFWPCRTFTDLDDVNRQAAIWRDQIANVRIHGTTNEIPCTRFQPQALRPLPDILPDTRDTGESMVHKDCRFSFDGNKYSAPHWMNGKMLLIKADNHAVVATYRDKIIAQHPRTWQRKAVIENPAHIQDLLRTRKKAQLTKQQELFLSLGPQAEAFLTGLAQANKNLSRAMGRLLELRNNFGCEALVNALQIAMNYKAFDTSYVENILYQLSRPCLPPGKIYLKDESLNQLDLQEPDLLVYDAIALKKRSQNHDSD